MKKRLLITSIVMMLVVAVALSTATYAWFTSNASVTANTVTMTAATSDLASISIAWLGNEVKSGTLTANVPNNSELQPMVPVALSATGTPATTTNTAAFDSSENAYGVQFNGASIGLNGKFDAEGSEKTPYTWQNADGVTAFYINNDSNVQALDISVEISEINFTGTDIEPLPAGTLLQKGQIYYKKVGNTWSRLAEATGENPTANWNDGTYVADVTTATGAEGDFVVYGTMGIEQYVRVAIFATTQYASTAQKPLSVNGVDYKYKGVMGKAENLDVAYGAIDPEDEHFDEPSDLYANVNVTHPALKTTDSVTVIEDLDPLARVYVMVLVWIDGTYFTAHESGQQATVGLTFNATNAN